MQFLAVVLTKIVGQGTFQQRCDNLFHLSNQRRFFSCVPLKVVNSLPLLKKS